ncbi:MAG: AMP-binding protein, partial [Xanthobacteraceae bacterium]
MTLVEMDSPTRDGRGKDSALGDWVRALEATAPIARQPQRILLDAIDDIAQIHGDAPALIAEHGSLTYRALVERSRRYARWALGQKLGKGQTVCLMMPNRPDYMAAWLGITAVGGVVSLVNTQLRGPSLTHCIDIVAPAHAIVAAECVEQFRSAQLSTRPKIWSYGDTGYLPIDRELERFSPLALTHAERRATLIADRALTIYTSGTTGLPKAANISHRRIMQWSLWFAGLMNTGPDERMYDSLPMY